MRKKPRKLKTVTLFSPDAPEARDEGPRLIPHPSGEVPVLPDHRRYIALADEALGTKPKVPRKPKR